MEVGTASVYLVRVLSLLFRRMGVDADALFREVGIAELPEDPDARIPAEAFYRLLEIGPVRTGDDAFGLHAAEAIREGDYGILELVIRSAPTAGDALRRFAEYYPLLLRDTIEMRIDVGDRDVTLVHRKRASSWRQDTEMLLASVVLRAGAMTGVPMPVRAVRFAHPAPSDVSEHARIFRAPVSFAAPDDALVFPAAYMTVPLVTADPAVSEVTRRYADLLMSEIATGDPLLDSVRRVIAETLQTGPTLVSISRRLGMAPRTLQRKLRGSGASLKDLIDDVRRGMAERYLGRSDTALTEVAHLIGFAEQSTFNRAFRRWTGKTPGEYRAATKT